MKILYLGPYNKELILFLEKNGHHIYQTEDKVSLAIIINKDIDYIISYGYRHIITKEVLKIMRNKIINLHISYLPWNRGADPNLWSFVENTPKGVTIHYIDEGIDTGDIIVQKKVSFSDIETLETSYKKLHKEMIQLFIDNWDIIKSEDFVRKRQSINGSYHNAKDKTKLSHLLKNGWETPVSNLKNIIVE